MPVSIPSPVLPDSVDPKNASVFDPLYKTLMRKAVSISGANDPNTMAQAAMPSPLVAAVPPEEIHMLKGIGKTLVERIKNEGLGGKPAPKNLVEALEFVQGRYPRLFGHVMELGAHDPQDIFDKAQGVRYGMGPQGKFSAIDVSVPRHEGLLGKIGLKAAPEEYANTLGHELLHAADGLTIPNMTDRYFEAEKVAGDYKNNPYEIRARAQGESTAAKLKAHRDATVPSIKDSLMSWFK